MLALNECNITHHMLKGGGGHMADQVHPHFRSYVGRELDHHLLAAPTHSLSSISG